MLLAHRLMAANPFGPYFNVSAMSYTGKSHDVSAIGAIPNGLVFKPDGTKMYVIEDLNSRIRQYSLSTAWDVSTASYDSVQYSAGSFPNDIFIKADGTKLYVVDRGNDVVRQHTLSTAWDLSTASYDSKEKDVSSETGDPFGLFFKPDGVKMYVADTGGDRILQYTLSTAWDVSTASYDSVAGSLVAENPDVTAVAFNPIGKKMYVAGRNTDSLHVYTLPVAWDVGTIIYDGLSFDFTTQEINPHGIAFDPDMQHLFMVGRGSQTVFQYSD